MEGMERKTRSLKEAHEALYTGVESCPKQKKIFDGL